MKDKKYGMNETICALATAPGVGAIAVIRVSGPDTFEKVSAIFKGKNLKDVPGNTVVFGNDSVVGNQLGFNASKNFFSSLIQLSQSFDQIRFFRL